jgi:hypothetical protein
VAADPYEQGQADMAWTIARLIASQLEQGKPTCDVLDTIVTITFARLELTLPEDQWFTRHGETGGTQAT